MRKTSFIGELIFLTLLEISAGYFLSMSGDFAVSMMDKSGGAGLFPAIVLKFLMVVIGIRIVLILAISENRKDEFVFLELFKGTRLFLLLTIIGYAIVVDFVGYMLSSIIFLLVTVNYFYYKVNGSFGNKKTIIVRNIIIIVFTILIFLFFTRILGAVLPTSRIL